MEQRAAMFQHTAARRRLLKTLEAYLDHVMFQHTAARRRLLILLPDSISLIIVSTHSRAEAAASVQITKMSGGAVFQHTAARRRLPNILLGLAYAVVFQHTAARRRLPTIHGT